MILHGDSLHELKHLEANSVDFVCTDPPYGYSFMGKDWDRAVPSVEIWQQCLRVLKPGAFMCVMSAPRSDVQNAMISRLMEAGFRLDFTPIYWTYASGFPKAGNIGKLVDKRLGAERTEGARDWQGGQRAGGILGDNKGTQTITKFDTPATDQAKALDGSYAGFQPKPAVEVIIVAMKPLSEKTYVDQALANGHGISWLDDGRIPTTDVVQPFGTPVKSIGGILNTTTELKDPYIQSSQGRFPANLLVSDDVLNDGHNVAPAGNKRETATTAWSPLPGTKNTATLRNIHNDTGGSYSRFFDLDKWASTLPFLITPKASKSEKNKGLEHMEDKLKLAHMRSANGTGDKNFDGGFPDTMTKNIHPTCKPLKLMSYLITLFSRPGDVVLDPFVGSGTTCVAAHNLGRETIGIEREAEYVEIARARLAHVKPEIVQLPPEKPEAAEPPTTLEAVIEFDQLRLL